MKNSRAVARQTLAAEGSAERVEELHQLVTAFGEQLVTMQQALDELLTRYPAGFTTVTTAGIQPTTIVSATATSKK
jgi:uncharacterized protein YxjI